MHALALHSSKKPLDWFRYKFLFAFGAALLADWLFLNPYPFGLSLVLFLSLLGAITLIANPVRAKGRARSIVMALYATGLLALLVDVSTLSMDIALGATLLFAVVMISGGKAPLSAQIRYALQLPFVGIGWFIADFMRVRRLAPIRRQYGLSAAWFLAWLVPLVLLATFLALFASANPLIDQALIYARQIDFKQFVAILPFQHIFFVAAFILFIWPIVHLRIKRRAPAKSADFVPVPWDKERNMLGILFGKTAILRSLVLFNILFALQTCSDIAYLWGGLALPAGFTHAAYAHRGAYQLVLTALLAAGFVLIAMRPNGPAEKSSLIPLLVLVWIGQNILLVASSVLRLDLYIGAYSLTYLRLAAFVWMGLVALGLALILAQILRRKTLRWLMGANVCALVVTLYACCFVNLPLFIASFNVGHSQEMGGSGPQLDINYIADLGPLAIPALDIFLAQQPSNPVAASRRKNLAKEAVFYDWRSWSFRLWRLNRYLETFPYSSRSELEPHS